MKKPAKRPDLPPRHSDNVKAWFEPAPTPAQIATLKGVVQYEGSPKHKAHPELYNLQPFNGRRGDATLCDRDAGFGVADMATIPALIDRALDAGLFGNRLWTVGDNGWIYEARITNVMQHTYHGYPVRANEAIAKLVYERFQAWALASGSAADKAAAENCKSLYGF